MNILLILFLSLMVSCTSTDKNVGAQQQEEASMKKKQQAPPYLYKIISQEDWQESQKQNYVINSPLDKDFIHLATEAQVPHVAEKFWKNKSYIVLKLDTKKLKGHLSYETNPGGTTYYFHLYEGFIPLEAVVETSSNT